MTDEVVTGDAMSENIGFTPLGEAFVTARNAKKLTQKDVSNHLRLSVKQVNALENNDFASLPQAMITRGFIRNYARFLALDAEPLLQSYRARVPDAAPNILTVQTSTRQVMLRAASTPWLKYVTSIILILLPLLAWFLYAEYLPKQANKAAENVDTMSAENTAAASLPEIALPAAERLPEAAVPVNAIEAKNMSAEVIQPNITQATQPLEAAKVVAPVANEAAKESAVDLKSLKVKAVSASQAKVALTELGAIKSVNMSVSEETWVRVTDKSGAVVFEKMLAANSTDGFDGLPPFKLLIGNAKATSLKFLGKPVDLTGATKNNVAHVTLE